LSIGVVLAGISIGAYLEGELNPEKIRQWLHYVSLKSGFGHLADRQVQSRPIPEQ
jgi:hypothetical protein